MQIYAAQGFNDFMVALGYKGSVFKKSVIFGPVTLTFWSLNSLMWPFVQIPRGFFHLTTNAVVVDYKNH